MHRSGNDMEMNEMEMKWKRTGMGNETDEPHDHSQLLCAYV